MSVKMRQEVERRIVARFVGDALKAGHRITVSYERGYDTDEMLVASSDRKAIMEAASAADECHLFVHDATSPPLDKGQIVSDGWVYLVFGNDGWDVISDYTTNLEPLLAHALRISTHYGE